jgi:sulfate transport system ATP-binding protein
MSISIRDVTKRFGSFTALDRVNVEVPTGSLVALLGPSGSGKTTLLRIIAGLEGPDSGNVFLHEEDASRQAARDRNIGFVFQHYALFRHMTVFDNIGFSLKMRGRPKQEIRERVMELLRLIQLEGVEKRYPGQLSGGQRQRVALARALAARPKVLLLDEPFGALDARVRQELRDWLRRLHDEIHVTSVFVTHDQEEALELADFIVVMNKGRVEQIGTPDSVYQQPASPFVMQFLGQVNLFHGRVSGGKVTMAGKDIAMELESATTVVGYVRPHEVEVSRESVSGSVLAEVMRIRTSGLQVRLEMRLIAENRPIEALMTHERFHELALQQGETVYALPKQIKVFEQQELPEYTI